MPENILVVEYEPRYADLVRQALTGQPFHAWYARDGEEAMRALDTASLKLIVLSSVVPKVSAPDLIRAIRTREPLKNTPILLTVAGYAGTSPKQDAARMGASDILPKPYSESEFLGKVQQLLGVGQMTSSEIFGDLVDAEPVARSGARKAMNPKDDVDKMLEQTLAGVMGKKRGAPRGASELDKRLQDTLSGIEKSARSTPRVTRSEAPAAAVTAPPEPDTAKLAQPIFNPAAAAAAAKYEEEPSDGIAFGQYVLLEKIATGGMAEVWKARMRGVEGFQKIVAIKKILPHLSDNQEFVDMFVDEAKLAAQLNHNNIIHIYDLGKIANSYYIAMEYVDGHDLKTILKRAEDHGHPMTVELALFVASKIASALDYAHRRRDFNEKELSLVHRDVSPQNVLISQEGDIKLCDFGIAKAATKASHTQVGALKGKLQYMSPEQASGKSIDRRSDIFALGAVLFEMLTGRKLFTGDNEISILEQVREARITSPSHYNDEVTPEIDRIVAKALEKDPAARYQSAGEMARDIDPILYSMRPTPTSADLAIYMHHIWSAEPTPRLEERPPEVSNTAVTEIGVDLDRTPAAATLAATAPSIVAPPPAPKVEPAVAATGVHMPAWDAPSAIPPEKKRSAALPIVFAAVLLAAIASAFFYVRGRSEPAAAPQNAAARTANTVAPPSTAAGAPAVAGTSAATTTAPPLTATTASTATAPDAGLVDQEVQKRLAAERARLEQEARAQQTLPATTAAVAPPQPRPAPPQQQPAPVQVTQTVAPVTQTFAPAPPPPPPTATQAAVTQTQPPAAEAAPAPQRVREGDLVPPGTEGLVPAHVVRRANVPYPPMARAEHVQGTVILSVLVSETGQVLDVRILRGIGRSVGLDEAAVQIARRSTFSAPTKDGVRVKAWTTLPVDFKL
ncbi:MAG TPA: TonB family protein [Thermoanaerobaculia bacterium]